MLRNIFEGLGSFFEWTFGIFDVVSRGMNLVFMLVVATALLYWLNQMVKHNKAGEK